MTAGDDGTVVELPAAQVRSSNPERGRTLRIGFVTMAARR
jgi:hypothetical protein